MGNRFICDPNCVALWQFEDSPGFASDSIGNNDLTNNGADPNSSDFKEGVQSASFVRANTDYMDITDSALDAGFPFRYADGGSATATISISFWIYPNSLPSVAGTQVILGKYLGGGSNLRTFMVYFNSDDCIRFHKGYNSGASNESVSFGTALQSGRWYHVGITYDESDYSYRMRIWDDTAQDFLASDVTGNFTNATSIMDVDFSVGAYPTGINNLDGIIDELVVFNRVLSTDEIDAIRSGTFDFLCTTTPPTTLAPTTLAPTTLAPTTLAPTTLAPTTLAPTTLAPTTLAPTTLAPTTLAPTTLPPTTLAPTTLAPTTLPPTTLAPTTVAPTTEPPTTSPPTTIAPTTVSPTTEPPTTAPPTTISPTTLPPTTLSPTTLEPTTLPPTTITPTTLVPTTEVPTTVSPTTIVPTTIVTTLPPTSLLPTSLIPTSLLPTTLVLTTLVVTTEVPVETSPDIWKDLTKEREGKTPNILTGDIWKDLTA